MPAGSPPGGLDRRFFLGDRLLESAGLDGVIDFVNMCRDPGTGNILVCGDNDYVGLMSNGIWGELIEGANLPPHAGTITGCAVNQSSGGWLTLSTFSDLFRGAADLASAWVDITPAPATARNAIIEWRGRLLLGTARLAGPARNIEFSDDNGATWDSDPGLDTGFAFAVFKLATNDSEDVLIATATAGSDAAFSTDDLAAVWTLWPLATPGGQQDAAVSDDGLKAVIVGAAGAIHVTDDFSTFTTIPVASNPFQNSTTTGTAIGSVEYVAAMAGFVLMSQSGPSVGFIPENDITNIFMGSYIGTPIVLPDRAGVSDGTFAMFAGDSNRATITMRRIGQLGTT